MQERVRQHEAQLEVKERAKTMYTRKRKNKV
jgi:hypothetical protein